jgi:uncharacterized membrane protein YeiH
MYANWREIVTEQSTEGASSYYCKNSQVHRTEGEAYQQTGSTCMLLTFIYLTAITVEAMSGALAAGRRNMDMFGVALIAFVTALGGGTVRDVILGHYPIAWTQHASYVYLTIGAGLLTTVIARFMHRLKKVFLILDGMGLVAFTIIGASVAQELAYSNVVVVMSGMITGVFGGILRDILCNRTPVVLMKELYASVSLLVALLFIGLQQLGIEHDITLVIAFISGFSVRMAAIYWKWSLPVFSYSNSHWED